MEPRNRIILECILWFYLSLLSNEQRGTFLHRIDVKTQSDLAKLPDRELVDYNNELRSKLRTP